MVGFLAVSGDCESHGGPFSVSVEMGQMVSDGVHITVAYQQEKWAYACVYTHITYIYMYNIDTCNILQSYDIVIHRDTLKTNTTWAPRSISLVAPVLRRWSRCDPRRWKSNISYLKRSGEVELISVTTRMMKTGSPKSTHLVFLTESIWYLFFESIWYHFLESIWYPSDLTWNPNIRSIRWFADFSKLLIGFLLIFQLILLIFQLIFQLILGEIDVSLQEFGDPSLRFFLAAKATKVYQDPGIQGTQWETWVFARWWLGNPERKMEVFMGKSSKWIEMLLVVVGGTLWLVAVVILGDG